jgi:hypothetical protein
VGRCSTSRSGPRPRRSPISTPPGCHRPARRPALRVYLPATVPLLGTWLTDGVATSAGPAYAVTGALREWYRDGDGEELEYVAGLAAATAALTLLAEDPTAPRRRVVLAVEVADAVVVPGGGEPAAVGLAGPVPKKQWASALVDDEAAEAVVAAAIANLDAAAAGDEDAAFALDEAAAYELNWFAVQELPHLLG